jgi:epoxyqueuosine reductase
MAPEASLTTEIISQAESYDGIRAGIAHLEDILQGPSYQATPEGPGILTQLDDVQVVDWLREARTVLILGLNHPKKDPRLDWEERGDTWGNRHLRKISESLKQWLREKYDLDAQPLPYHVEKGGLFLKDAAVLSGIGIIGLEGDLQTTEALEGFSPCETCEGFCQKACPMKAFPQGKYSRPICHKQMNADVVNKVPDGEIGENGKRNLLIKWCRACELSCPVGA